MNPPAAAKGNVRARPPPISRHTYDFPTGAAAEAGYFLLAYHLHNYGAACKTCNSPFKSDYFPVAQARVSGMANPEDYAAEEPFLVYPLGALGDDPRELVTFDGVTARPKDHADVDNHRWRRGRVIIDFFGLNRDGLIEDRAWWLLMAVVPNLELADTGRPDGARNVEVLRSARSPFTSCAECFIRLWQEDRPRAEAMIPEFKQIVDTMQG